MNTAKVQCDCCDYFTLDDGADYEICPICFWEQDAFGISEPDEASGPNHGLSLREGRKNFVELGASSAQFVEKVVPVWERASYCYALRTI